MKTLLSLLLLVVPVKIEHGRFTITKDGKKIGTDEFTVAMRGSNYLIDGKVTIGDLSISSQMELDETLALVSYEVSSPEGAIKLKIASPVSELQTTSGRDTSSADFRFPVGGIILDNNVFHQYLVLMYRAQAGQNNFSVFVPQDMSVGTAIVRSTGARTYDLDVGDIRMQATTAEDGRLVKLTVPAAKVVVQR